MFIGLHFNLPNKTQLIAQRKKKFKKQKNNQILKLNLKTFSLVH